MVFNTSEEICDYLLIKNPNFCHRNISEEILAKIRGEMKFPKEIPNFMKHHLMVFAPDTDVKINTVYVIARNACK